MGCRAYNRMRLADGTLLEGPLVVDEGAGQGAGGSVSWHRLEGEEPFTEWVGGTYAPLPGTEVRERERESKQLYSLT